jgi:hypothetical protein
MLPARPTGHAQDQLYQNLLNKAMGDKQKVERLIAYEGMRAPHLFEQSKDESPSGAGSKMA